MHSPRVTGSRATFQGAHPPPQVDRASLGEIMLENHASPQTDKPAALQPMGLLDIVDRMFSIYRHHARLFFGLAALYFVFGSGVKMGAAFIANSDFSLLGGWLDNVFELGGRFVVQLLIIGGLVFASAHCYLGNDVSRNAALRQTLRRFWHHLGSGALWVCAAAGLWIAFMFVGITYSSPEGYTASLLAAILIGMPFGVYFGIRWLFHTVLVLFEERSVRVALKRSSELVEDTWWRVFGITLAIYAVGIAIQWILEFTIGSVLILTGITAKATFMELLKQVVMEDASPGKMGLLAYAIQEFIFRAINALVVPLYSIGTTLLYFDLRIRKEGFDIEMLARNE